MAMGGSQRGGRYKAKTFVRTQREKLPPYWARWVQTYKTMFVQIVNEEQIEDHGPNIVLYIPKSPYSISSFAIDFTAFSPAELKGVGDLLKSCIDLATPIVAHRDEVANERLRNGDDSDPRVYRAVPTVVIRPWAESLDSESILNRPRGFLPSDGPRVDSRPGSTTYGSVVAESDKDEVSSPDDESEINLA